MIENPKIEILEIQAVEEMVMKVRHSAGLPDEPEHVAAWKAQHGEPQLTDDAHAFCVVGETLMFLHRCPDGVILPFAAYPDGTIKVYCDPIHAGESFE